MSQLSMSRWHSNLVGLVIGTLVSSIIAILYLQGFLRVYEWKTRDLRQAHVAPERRESSEIVIIDIDEESLERLRNQYSWPWPRQIYKYVLAYLMHAKVRAVVFDMLFVDRAPSMIDPDKLDPLVKGLRTAQIELGCGSLSAKDASLKLGTTVAALAELNQHNDDILAEWLGNTGNAFLAAIFDPSGKAIAGTDAQRFGLRPDKALEIFHEEGPLTGTAPLLPVKKLYAAAAGVGHINYVPHADGIVRSMHLFLRCQDRLFPSLALRVAMHLVGADPSAVFVNKGDSFRLSKDGQRLFVPMDRAGALLINYSQRFRRLPFYKVSASALQFFADERTPIVDLAELRGKTVFIGASAKGLHDLKATPVAAQHLGVEVQAQVLANLMDGNFLRETSRPLTVAIIYASGVLLGVLLQRIGPALGTLLSVLCLCLYCAAATYAFRVFSVWIDVVAPGVAMIFCHIAIIGHKFSSVERQHFLEKQLLQHELDIAHDVQMSLLPKSDPVVPNADISGWTRPCDDTGGDYYDFVALEDGRLAIALGDVTGHGLGPALIMAATRSYIRSIVHHASSPGEVLTTVNNLLCGDLENSRFVTMFFCIFDPRTGEITYSSAGHEAPLILRAGSDDIDEMESTGLPLGLMPDEAYEDGLSVRLREGDLLMILTDGVFEAMNRRQEQFGNERLIGFLRANLQLPAADVIQKLHSAVEDFRGKAAQQDDITMVVVKMAEQDDVPSDEVQFEDA